VKIFKNENNVMLTTLISLILMLVTLSLLTTAILFAANYAENASKIPQNDTKTTQKAPISQTPSTTKSDQTSQTVTTTTPLQTTEDQSVVTPPTPPRKKVAVTFDDGPNGSMTYKFVDKLKEYGAAATFFVVGNRMGQNNGAALKYAIENGCEVGLHSYSHAYYNKMTMDEYLADLQKAHDAVNKYVETEVSLMRPPGGILSAAQRDACPYTAVLWSVVSNDWKYTGRSDEKRQTNIQTIVDNVMSQVKEGDIVLMHELYDNSYDAFCIIIEQLYEQGYEIVTVSELLGDERVVPGTSVYHAR